MDSMFNNGHREKLNNNSATIMTSDENDVIVDVVNDDDDQSLTDALQSSMNKRKLTNTAVINQEQHNENGNDSAKRLRTMNDHQ